MIKNKQNKGDVITCWCVDCNSIQPMSIMVIIKVREEQRLIGRCCNCNSKLNKITTI